MVLADMILQSIASRLPVPRDQRFEDLAMLLDGLQGRCTVERFPIEQHLVVSSLSGKEIGDVYVLCLLDEVSVQLVYRLERDCSCSRRLRPMVS